MTRVAALGLAAALCGCGVKGPPRPPERPVAATPVRPEAAPAPAEPDADTTCDACGEARPAAGGAEGR